MNLPEETFKSENISKEQVVHLMKDLGDEMNNEFFYKFGDREEYFNCNEILDFMGY